MDVVGVTRVRNCCSFVWVQDERQPRRQVLARPYHCAACVGEMVRSAKLQRITVTGSPRMDRLRGALADRKGDLLERWRRQLRASAEAGFALDPRTAEVLPEMLDATDRALERRFRGPSPGEPVADSEARSAAIQCSLLRDFVLDTTLEILPDIGAAEERLLGEALAHAGVQVLARRSLVAAQERRRRDSARLGRLAHDLRNAATAARLAFDLLRRREALQDSRTARLLDASIAALRDGIEDTLLDDALSAGSLRLGQVALAPVVEKARTAAAGMGAREKNVRVVLAASGDGLRARADARLVEPAVRGLLRAALHIARPGATIRLGADRSGAKAHVAVSVDGCCRLPGNRLHELAVLSLARRAARLQGGSLTTSMQGRRRCDLRFSLPRVQER